MATFLTTEEDDAPWEQTDEALFGPGVKVTYKKPEKEGEPQPEQPKPNESDPKQAPLAPPQEVISKEMQQRMEKMGDQIRNFSIAISGGGDLVGGFGKIPDKDLTLDHLEKSFKDFLLQGHNGIQAHGSIEKGYALSGNPTEPTSDGFPSPIPGPPVEGCPCDLHEETIELADILTGDICWSQDSENSRIVTDPEFINCVGIAACEAIIITLDHYPNASCTGDPDLTGITFSTVMTIGCGEIGDVPTSTVSFATSGGEFLIAHANVQDHDPTDNDAIDQFSPPLPISLGGTITCP